MLKKKIKKGLQKKSFVVFEGALFSAKKFNLFYSTFIEKMHLIPIQDLFTKNMHVIKRKEIAAFQQSFSQCW